MRAAGHCSKRALRRGRGGERRAPKDRLICAFIIQGRKFQFCSQLQQLPDLVRVGVNEPDCC
jgi:hypothetical protein